MGSILIAWMVKTGTLVVRKLGRDRAVEVAIHRFLSLPSVTTAEMVEALAARAASAYAGREIIVAEDTTKINFAGHENRQATALPQDTSSAEH
jgi:hypothetical protein